MEVGRVFTRALSIVALVSLVTPAALYAQGTTSLSGVVVDEDGGTIPGATVVITHENTGVATSVVTNTSGLFAVPALSIGTYSVTISLSGFKTAVVGDVRLVTGRPSDIGRVVLTIGQMQEFVNVVARAGLVESVSGAVSNTLTSQEIIALPMASRNATISLVVLPNVQSTGGNARGTVIGGLSQETINVTLDGVNIQDNNDKRSNGFQGLLRPPLDSLEEVTLTQAAQGADAAGQGAVQIRYTTRSGSNTLRGTVYGYFRHKSLNTKYFFSTLNGNPKPDSTLNQTGFSIGGPVVRNRLFYFVNLERLQLDPASVNTRQVLTADAQNGVFRYTTITGGVTGSTSVNLLALAAGRGQVSSHDPTILDLLNRINQSTASTGTLNPHASNPNLATYTFTAGGPKREYFPTLKLDYNISANHRVAFTAAPQTTYELGFGGDFPQFPNTESNTWLRTWRRAFSGVLRSVLGEHTVNELVIGGQHSPVNFRSGLEAEKFSAQRGAALTFGSGLSNYFTTQTSRNDETTPLLDITETLTMQRGRHSLTVGGTFTQITYTNHVTNVAPGITFGVQSGLDPADGMFTTANFPGASAANLTEARSLYALLTGRVTAINATGILNGAGQYEYLGRSTESTKLQQYGVFVQDAWRVRPNLTINAGLRWDYQGPAVTRIGSYSTATLENFCGVSGVGNGPGGRDCNIFTPQSAVAISPSYNQLSPGATKYNKDWDNFAPNLSVVWRPEAKNGLWRAVLGDPEQATIRAGFSRAFTRGAMGDFNNIFTGNPGRSISANRSAANGNLVLAGEAWPVLFRDAGRLGPPARCTGAVTAACLPATPGYPFAMTIANSAAIFDPGLELSYADSFSAGIQRTFGKNTAVEIRFLGTRNHGSWAVENWNEANIGSNGFTDEFKSAMSNLQENIKAGRGNTFAYFGAGTNTVPLPIMLAHLNGVASPQAGDAAMYTGGGWTNTTLTGFLAANNPNVRSFVTSAAGLYGNATFRANGRAAGLPTNFWVMNPNVNAANVLTNANDSTYNSLQIELRRRYVNGLQFNAGYVYGIQKNTIFQGLARERSLLQTANVPHAFKVSGVWDVPFGRDKRWGANASRLLNGLAGGWTASMAGRYQWRTIAMSGVRLVGMSLKELQSEYRYRIDLDRRVVTLLPDDIILNTRRAFDVSATSATGYGTLGVPEGRYLAPASSPGCVAIYRGDCGEPEVTLLRAPISARTDLSFRKRFGLGGAKHLEVQFDLLNAFGAKMFIPVANPGTAATIFRVNAGVTGGNATFEPGGQTGQLMLRVNW